VKNIRQLFDRDNPADSFVITDEFCVIWPYQRAKGIPIFRLKIGSFHMTGGQAVAG
jgi:chromosome partitioning protein